MNISNFGASRMQSVLDTSKAEYTTPTIDSAKYRCSETVSKSKRVPHLLKHQDSDGFHT
jgi:hypothetical protein